MKVVSSRAAAAALVLIVCAAAGADEFVDGLWVRKDACPFECCAFGRWKVTEAVAIRGRPEAESPLLGMLSPGRFVVAETGVLYVKPGRARIIGPPHYSAGSVDLDAELEILDYWGETYSRVRQHGRVFHTKVARSNEDCKDGVNRSHCWVEILEPPQSTWWARIRAGDGHSAGWVRMYSTVRRHNRPPEMPIVPREDGC